MMLWPDTAQSLRRETELEEAREQRWVNTFMELTGFSESQARSCWMFVPTSASERGEPAPVRLDGSSPSLASLAV
ncbi:MAG: hypothetical protein JWO95_2920 [Verrucomicrobiales bacterium]|nr:hypothetical protein [Verrucomicrobiales bacterium]